MNVKLIEFINYRLVAGYSKALIIDELVKAGYPIQYAENALQYVQSQNLQNSNQASDQNINQQSSFYQHLETTNQNTSGYSQIPTDKPTKKFPWKVFIIFLTLLIFISLSSFAWWYYPRSNFYLSKLFYSVYANSQNLKSAQYSYSLDMNMKSTYLNNSSFQSFLKNKNKIYLASSDLETTTKFNSRGSGSFDINEPDKPQYSLQLSAKYNNDFNIEVELREIIKTVFFKINQIPQFPGFDVSAFRDKWIRYEMTTLPETIQNNVSDSTQTKIQSNFQKNNFIKITKFAGREKIEGNNTNQYEFSIDNNKLKDFTTEMVEIYEDRQLDMDERSNVEDAVNSTVITGKFWLGTKDKNPYRLEINLKTNPESKMFKSVSGEIILTIDMTHFNERIAVEEPKESIAFEEFYKTLMEQYSKVNYQYLQGEI